MALSDEMYIHQTTRDQSLYLYEDLKINKCAMINEDLIKRVFMKCEYDINHSFQYQIQEIDSENAEYTNLKQVMEKIVCSFNECHYLDTKMAKNCIFVCDFPPRDSNVITSNSDYSVIKSDSKAISNVSEQTNMGNKSTYLALFKWFSLIYELKYIFGDINSKFKNITFV
ncbi:hypothetical protein RF11_15081 [Thelohanellus kitauei]|uniref:Uncharacterized protein n=1 Tax=Thelohanellus kitauei TaxID=669202 RepID=A0A0C2MMM3_THEKT|nr:hypothetical protein RF11_15081 [Thelohanellus kitauei]